MKHHMVSHHMDKIKEHMNGLHKELGLTEGSPEEESNESPEEEAAEQPQKKRFEEAMGLEHPEENSLHGEGHDAEVGPDGKEPQYDDSRTKKFGYKKPMQFKGHGKMF